MTMYEYGNFEFIWGIESGDDFYNEEPNLFTVNDLDIVYHKDTNSYHLGVETIYRFMDGNEGEIKYLENLLDRFTAFIKEEKFILPENLLLAKTLVSNPFEAKTIPELYLRFKIFVEGYKAVCRTPQIKEGSNV